MYNFSVSFTSPAAIDNSSGQTIKPSDEQAARLDQILKVLDHIRQVGASHRGRPLGDDTRSKIDEELKQLKSPRDHSSLALMCRAIGDHEHDFYIASDDRVDRLAEDTSDDAVDGLNLSRRVGRR